ncbi:hypothetical protein [Paenibacillus macerans]|uniref:hypothetical protein n=1 Tax=Paenibacillus macerans TaxID=44252 RepID=UPI00203D808E|nr:hypothetical protein [Paenibacillus macerans]MCM3703788.1 hypothetical protein [Paenibacillus macerans]
MATSTSTPTGYGSNIRQSLVGKGVNNNDIGYNKATGYVTVKGQDFMKPSKVLDGVSYDTVSGFNKAWNSYQSKSQPSRTSTATTVPSGLVSTRQGLGSYGIDNNRVGYNNGNVTVDNRTFGQPTLNQNGTSYYLPSALQSDYTNFQRNGMTNALMNYQMPTNPYTQQISDQINYLMDYAKNQRDFDPYDTAEYAARKAQAEKSSQQGVRAAQEALGSSGFGRSTMLSDRAQGIQNEANEYLETQILPQIIANEEARRQQQFANIASLLNPLMSQQQYADNRALTERSNIMDTLGYLNNEDQRAFQNSVTAGQLTGNYMPPQAQELVNQILQLKQAAESPNVTREQRAQLSSQADQLRSRLDAFGIDSSLVGANVNYNTARGTQIGIPTLANKELAINAQNQKYNQEMQTKKFEEDVRQFGLQYALQKQAERNDQAYRNSQLALSQDDNMRQWAALDYEMSQPGTVSSPLSANQVLQSMASIYTDPDTEQITSEPSKRKQLIQNVVDSGLSNAEIQAVLSSLGFAREEMQNAIKEAASGN